jgi:hypothetical protein
MPKLEDFDHPLVFLVVISIGVIGISAFMGWVFSSLGWTGPLGLVKGGVSQS